MTRRRFLVQGATAVGGAMLLRPGAVGAAERPPPSGRLTMAIIGCGNQGLGELGNWLSDERVQVVAVCDPNLQSPGYWDGGIGGREPARARVDEHYGRQTRSGTHRGCFSCADYREVLARDDIDTVYIGTPDHWHALIAVAACRAGKDIYGQKPLALTIPEGRAIVRAVERYARVWQTGSQQRSDGHMRRACEYVLNGRIGQLRTVRVGLPGGTPDIGKTGAFTHPEPVPAGFDYDVWLGPAPWAPHCRARTHVNWRWNLDYSGGQITDWGAHHIDTALWGMGCDRTGPLEVGGAEAVFGTGLWNTAQHFRFEARFANGVRLVVSDRERDGVTFEGSAGEVHTNRGVLETKPESIRRSRLGPEEVHLYESNHHFRNFVDSVLSRGPTAAPAECAHRAVTVAHLGNLALRTGTDVRWDPEREEILDNPAAQALVTRTYRAPWQLPA